MAQLGMDDRELKSFKRVLQLPHGIILVTGPTGSGKTTTLYVALNAINDVETKIITIEDPIEYQLKGVNQIQVNEKSGLTFARGLRSILRHDPDVVLIGEIRDTETAQIAVQASLTGHLVFSTLHTNDAPGAVTRLVDMKVEPYLVASSLEAVLAQRLVRVLCTHCKVEDHSDTTAAIKEQLGFPARPQGVQAPSVAANAATPAIIGRHAIFEWMDMNSRNSGKDFEKLFRRRNPRGRPAQRAALAERRRLAARRPGHHHARGSHARHQGPDPGQRGEGRSQAPPPRKPSTQKRHGLAFI